MSYVKISYSVEADAKNWLRIWNKQKSTFGISQKYVIDFIPKELRVSLGKKTEEQKLVSITAYLKEQKTLISYLKNEADALQLFWNKYEAAYIKVLEKTTEKKIFGTSISVQLTSASLCPYDEKHNWFMVSGYGSLGAQITTIAHETMHLQFIHWYKTVCFAEGLSPQQFEDLKESLTVLLNADEFSKIIVCPDRGYERHIKFRKKIEIVWKKKLSFEQFLKKVIVLIKKETLR